MPPGDVGAACIYVKKPADIDQKVLVRLMQATVSFLKEGDS